MELGFVFTNYNNSDFTEKAIESIEMIQKQFFKIVVVDNNSEEDDVLLLKKIAVKYPNVSVICLEKNVGYFKGLNQGIKYLREHFPSIEHMVIGNNDVLFYNDFYETILAKNNLMLKYPVIAPNIITVDGFHQNPHVISQISKLREIVYDIYHVHFFFAKTIIKLAQLTQSVTDRKDEEQHEDAQEIYQGYGACYILTPLFFKNFKSLWSPTFLM